ncbi:MAG: anthranilate synthase component I [Opitutae bacterium]|nr:anthranilate synthase component I [Opitutae bacterium]
MQTLPSLEDFKVFSQKYDIIAVKAEFTADAETPLSAYVKLSSKKPAFLFESVVGGEQVSRFSFVGCNPQKIVTCWHNETVIIQNGKETKKIPTPTDPLKIVEEEMKDISYLGFEDETRFSGGAVGYISYEYANRVEPSVPIPDHDELKLPLLSFMMADLVIVFDHARQSMTVCANVSPGNNPEKAYQYACSRIQETIKLLSSPSTLSPTPIEALESAEKAKGNLTKEEFEELVLKTQEFIRSGDIIQAVLSQRFSIPYTGPSINLYRAIRAINPSPYMFLMEDEEFSVVGASPEVHVRLTGEDVLIRPIAGTRPRGKTDLEDKEFELDLLADEKEKAEHLMLVDLARNDIGRVCKTGTIKAAEFMTIERYSHVMHIVSEVVGKLDPSLNGFDLLRATFPAGTVSGAPKVRAMQIIADFEKSQRNIYAGALGYFGYEGNHDSCIAIRTAIIKNNILHLQAGAGIVADSIPENEYQETINKAKGMLKALALAEKITA